MSKFSVRPLYLQVHDLLMERIVAGEWKPNAAVPNETDLAREMGVSPGTMRKALDLLESDGLVTRRQGRGTFVNDPVSSELAMRYDNLRGPDGAPVIGEISALDVTRGTANEAERARLRLDQQEQVCRIRRTRSHMANTYMAEDASLPEAVFPALAEADICSRGVVAIAHAYGVMLGRAVERVTLGAASRWSAETLHIAEGAPVLLLDRIVVTRDGRPAEWRRAECNMSAMHYNSEMS